MPRVITKNKLLKLQIINQLALLNQSEAAAIINKSPAFVDSLVQLGQLKTLYGKHKNYLIARIELDDWLRSYTLPVNNL